MKTRTPATNHDPSPFRRQAFVVRIGIGVVLVALVLCTAACGRNDANDKRNELRERAAKIDSFKGGEKITALAEWIDTSGIDPMHDVVPELHGSLPPESKIALASAIGRVGHPDLLPNLEKIARNGSDSMSRRCAVTILANLSHSRTESIDRFGPPPSSILPLVIESLADTTYKLDGRHIENFGLLSALLLHDFTCGAAELYVAKRLHEEGGGESMARYREIAREWYETRRLSLIWNGERKCFVGKTSPMDETGPDR